MDLRVADTDVAAWNQPFRLASSSSVGLIGPAIRVVRSGTPTKPRHRPMVHDDRPAILVDVSGSFNSNNNRLSIISRSIKLGRNTGPMSCIGGTARHGVNGYGKAGFAKTMPN